jgi:RNA-directed DNA polymerase
MSRPVRRDLKIEDCGLYAAVSPAYLAVRISTPRFKIEADELQLLAKDVGNFNVFPRKERGKERLIQEPKARLQRVHLRVHKLLSRVAVPDYLHSAVKGRSYISNAAAHRAEVRAIKIDVKKFFRSVPRVAVFKFFKEKLKCRDDVAGLLAQLLTFNGYLPTGSSASPIISFYSFKPMFDAIATLAEKNNLSMTCYVDDMTLSGEGATNTILQEVRKIIASFGLKSHKARLFEPSQPRVVTGICLTNAGDKVPNKLHLKIKKGFDQLATAVNEKEKGKVLRPLLGRLEAAGQIDPIFKARATTLRAVNR